MNQISSALAKAGVKIPPLLQRVWQVLHDQKGPRSAKALASMLNLPQSRLSSALSKLKSRGMVAVLRRDLTRCKGSRGAVITRLVAQYGTLGTEYELLPVLPTTKAEPAKAELELRVDPLEFQAVRPATIDIEKMTLAEAHDLYRRLKEFFA